MLKDKHKKALALLRENKLTHRAIAKLVGISSDYLKDLMTGDPKAGNVGQDFHVEYQKIEEEIDKRIRRNTKDILDLSSCILSEWLKQQIALPDKSEQTIKLIKDIQFALSKSRPSIEIGQFSYTRGLTAEDLVNEFKRLSRSAQASLVRSRVQGPESGGSRAVSDLTGRRSKAEEGSEDTDVYPDAPSEEVSPE